MSVPRRTESGCIEAEKEPPSAVAMVNVLPEAVKFVTPATDTLAADVMRPVASTVNTGTWEAPP